VDRRYPQATGLPASSFSSTSHPSRRRSRARSTAIGNGAITRTDRSRKRAVMMTGIGALQERYGEHPYTPSIVLLYTLPASAWPAAKRVSVCPRWPDSRVTWLSFTLSTATDRLRCLWIDRSRSGSGASWRPRAGSWRFASRADAGGDATGRLDPRPAQRRAGAGRRDDLVSPRPLGARDRTGLSPPGLRAPRRRA
jgi:hypothetical protein